MSEDAPGKELFELFQKMLTPMAFPMQSLLLAGLNTEEIDKKISELKAVQHWLNANMGMLELTIKTLEYQKAVLAPGSTESTPDSSLGNLLANPALWPWNLIKPDEGKSAAPEPPKKGSRKR